MLIFYFNISLHVDAFGTSKKKFAKSPLYTVFEILFDIGILRCIDLKKII